MVFKMNVKIWRIVYINLTLVVIFMGFYFSNVFNVATNYFGLSGGSGGKRYSLLTAGCQIERLDPWDKTITKYFKKLRKFECDVEDADVLVSQTEDGRFLSVNEKAKKKLFEGKMIMNISSFKCTKREVYRNEWEKDDRYTYRLSDNVTQFTAETEMDVEYAEIKCFAENKTLYENYFFYPIRKPKVENECATNSRSHVTDHPTCQGVPRLSVLVMGTDSVSKSNLLRNFPETIDYMVNDLSAIEMFGLNRVGLNTFPSLMPYLTGNSDEGLTKSCLSSNYKNKFDNCTFLWDMFAAAGYRTAFVENFDTYNMFLYNRGGFHRQVAHYYSHTIYVPAFKSNSIKHGCWRGKADDEMVIDWAVMFQKQFANDLHYGHFWTNIFSHNVANEAQHLDPIISRAFKKMKDENLLNNTFLVFMSDHGVRFGAFRETEIARLEENLPFMYLIFPDWFRKQYPLAIERVKTNARRLITNFDLHATLKDIINCNYTSITASSVDTPLTKRGISFFKLISDKRKCADADIPDVYCACQKSVTELNLKLNVSQEVASLVVSQLNAFTFPLRNVCSAFQLDEVSSVKQLDEVDVRNGSLKVLRTFYVVSVLVQPGAAKFEATVESLSYNNSTYVVDHDIRRINQYGNSSHCVSNDAFLKTICYCKNEDLISRT